MWHVLYLLLHSIPMFFYCLFNFKTGNHLKPIPASTPLTRNDGPFLWTCFPYWTSSASRASHIKNPFLTDLGKGSTNSKNQPTINLVSDLFADMRECSNIFQGGLCLKHRNWTNFVHTVRFHQDTRPPYAPMAYKHISSRNIQAAWPATMWTYVIVIVQKRLQKTKNAETLSTSSTSLSTIVCWPFWLWLQCKQNLGLERCERSRCP